MKVSLREREGGIRQSAQLSLPTPRPHPTRPVGFLPLMSDDERGGGKEGGCVRTGCVDAEEEGDVERTGGGREGR